MIQGRDSQRLYKESHSERERERTLEPMIKSIRVQSVVAIQNHYSYGGVIGFVMLFLETPFHSLSLSLSPAEECTKKAGSVKRATKAKQ